MRSPVVISNGCPPVLASYSAITRFTSSMSAVAGSYSRIVVSPCDENVKILAFMLGLLRDFVWLLSDKSRRGLVPKRHIAPISIDVKTAFPLQRVTLQFEPLWIEIFARQSRFWLEYNG